MGIKKDARSIIMKVVHLVLPKLINKDNQLPQIMHATATILHA